MCKICHSMTEGYPLFSFKTIMNCSLLEKVLLKKSTKYASRCFQLSTSLDRDFFRYLWYCDKIKNRMWFSVALMKFYWFGLNWYVFNQSQCRNCCLNIIVNYRRHVDSEKIRAPDGIWTHDPPWSSRMFYPWATGDSVVSKGQIVGIDWNRFAWLHSHVLAHMNSLTASCCHINASHMNSLTASRRHIKEYQDASNPLPKWVY